MLSPQPGNPLLHGECMTDGGCNSVSFLLSEWRKGDQQALELLIPLVYADLRRIAHRHLRHERPDHTLQSAALVNEAYLRFLSQGPSSVESRPHFLAIASRLMRQILVDYARSHQAAKRGHGLKVTLAENIGSQDALNLDLITLDRALDELASLDPQQSKVVEMRFFGGLTIEDTAEAIGVSPITVKREWATARAWLRREMGRIESV
jgi:RNA polymerase sigma factor (TIGR02999 family)